MADEENQKIDSFNEARGDSDESDVTFVESTEDGDELPKKDVLKKVREDLKICRQEKEEYLIGWQRAKADYINLQKELEQARISSGILAKEKMTYNLLPALDSFEIAFSHKESWKNLDPEWQKGLENIYQQFIAGLKKSGLEKIDQVDIPFDPNIHQSIKTIPTEEESKDHTIAEIFQIGYKLGDRIIRPARVIIFEYHKE